MTDGAGWTRWLALSLATTALVLGGCSRDGRSAARECRWFKKCDETAFFEAYNSKSDCKKLRKAQIELDITESLVEYGSLCAKARSKEIRCFSKQIDCEFFDDRDAWLPGAEEECSKESEEREAECVNDD